MDQKPIRILHVLTAMNRAGTETMLMNLYRSIDRSRVQFDFAVTTIKKADYDDEIQMLGGKIYHYPLYKPTNHLQYVQWWDQFYSEHPEYKIIHGHIGSTASIYLAIGKKYGRYTIAHSHNVDGKLSFKSIAYKIYSYSTRYIADYFFGCSTDALISRYGSKIAKNRGKSRVLKNAINIENYRFSEQERSVVRSELGYSKSDFILGTVGRLTKQKNPFFLIEILKKLKEVEPNFHFCWVGAGELYDDVVKAISEANLESNVHMLGVRNDVNRILQAIDVFLFPSLWEGLGIVAIEAQAAGLATLCSDAIPIEVNLTDNCRFLPLDNVQKWLNAIMEYREYERKDTSILLKNASYDIYDNANWLMQFYEKIWFFQE